MNNWKNSTIIRRAEGSYVIPYNGYPAFHVPNTARYAKLWAEIDAYAQEHPEQVTDEPAPPQPTEEELLARAKTLKTAELDRAMADIDAELIRSTTDLVAAMLSPATLAADVEAVNALSAEDLEKSRAVFASLRSLQAQNRALRAQVQAAQSMEEVKAIEPVMPDMAALAAME